MVTKPAPRPTGGVFISSGSLFSPPGSSSPVRTIVQKFPQQWKLALGSKYDAIDPGNQAVELKGPSFPAKPRRWSSMHKETSSEEVLKAIALSAKKPFNSGLLLFRRQWLF